MLKGRLWTKDAVSGNWITPVPFGGSFSPNVKLHNPTVTRDDVQQIYDELFVRDASTAGGDPARCKSPKSLGAVPS
jgi:hypothetical protein